MTINAITPTESFNALCSAPLLQPDQDREVPLLLAVEVGLVARYPLELANVSRIAERLISRMRERLSRAFGVTDFEQYSARKE